MHAVSPERSRFVESRNSPGNAIVSDPIEIGLSRLSSRRIPEWPAAQTREWKPSSKAECEVAADVFTCRGTFTFPFYEPVVLEFLAGISTTSES
jgi:hypothetical protein